MENRNGLVVSAVVTHADGFGENENAAAVVRCGVVATIVGGEDPSPRPLSAQRWTDGKPR
jgi:hypothetical protein